MKRIITLLIAFILSPLSFSQPTLELVNQGKSVTLDEAQLRKIGIHEVEIVDSPAYPKREMHYQAVKLCDLLRSYKVNPNYVIEFVAIDDFSVFIPARLVTQCEANNPVAYLAIEPDTRWPELIKHPGTTAGPYFLIWSVPEGSHISREYWAWSLNKIVIRESIGSLLIAPPENVPDNQKKSILNGYQLYISHCASCHKINKIGQGKLGPDLGGNGNPLVIYPDIATLKNSYVIRPQSDSCLKARCLAQLA